MSATELAIDTQGLQKVFGTNFAVRDLSLQVPRGEIFGFLGPNGAGKSTSIKMLLGLVRPTAGRATVLGAPVGDVETRRRIGFLPEDFRFYDWLTAAELLRFHGRLCGLTATALRTRVPEMLDLVGLTAHADRRVRGFSKGMLQRIGLAQALVHEPELVFLDEPTSGLDPMGRRMVRDILNAERRRGATVFLNSHLLGEVEITCDRVVFIKAGEVVAAQNLRDATPKDVRVVAHVRGMSDAAMEDLVRGTTGVQLEAERLVFSVRTNDEIPGVVRALVGHGVELFDLSPERVPLEELFVKIMGEDAGL